MLLSVIYTVFIFHCLVGSKLHPKVEFVAVVFVVFFVPYVVSTDRNSWFGFVCELRLSYDGVVDVVVWVVVGD